MSLRFLSTPPSCPCHFLGMSASFSMYVPFFRCESFPYISRRVDWCPCPLFPFHSPCTPLVFISVSFMSLSVPLCFPFISPCFPVMSTSYFLPSFPCTSLHFPFAPQYFPQKKTRCCQRFRKEDVTKTQSFSTFSARRGGKPKPAKSRQGDSSLGSLFCGTSSPRTTFSGTLSNDRAVRGDPPNGHGLASARGLRLAGARKFGLARACRGLDFVVRAVLWASFSWVSPAHVIPRVSPKKAKHVSLARACKPKRSRDLGATKGF